MPQITFVNHASVLISQGDRHLLTDPWYDGPAFHDGWLLLAETPGTEVEALLDRVTDIWLSHEHPDHFQPLFFKRHLNRLLARNIPIWFQKTPDNRVAGFLRGLGLTVHDMADGKTDHIAPDFVITMIKADFYDSALLIRAGGTTIFNFNDCHFTDDQALRAIRKAHGTCDVLLTQFSYAAWKGGPDNTAWRQKAAAEKIDGIRRQIAVLEPKAVLPFASYVRFANALNAYLNDAANRPADVLRALSDSPAAVIFLAPGEQQDLTTLSQNPDSLAYWDRLYAALPDMPVMTYRKTVTPDQLQTSFAAYEKRMKARNAAWLIGLIARLRLFGGFQPLVVELIDQNVNVRIDLAGGQFDETSEPAHVACHSASLDFVFTNDFGFDTLTVNGCFEERQPGGFIRMAKSLALGNLNNMGMSLSPGLIFNVTFVAIFLEKLRMISRNLRKSAT